MENAFRISKTFPASAREIYRTWLTSEGHTNMTGSPAQVEGKLGGHFSAWDGYITGSMLELIPDRRIVQSWRTSEFPDGAPDSRLEILLEEKDENTTIIIIHTNLPAEQTDSYRHGWQDFYFKPMKEYFGRK